MIGEIVSHYQILEKLGEGGMGVVYKAEDTKLKRIVALKFLPVELTRDREARERFMHEAQAASALEHENICNIHEIDETEDGRLFICMAYYEGEALKDRITRGPLPLDEALDYASQIVAGLTRAHGHGIVHRDIKPGNILLTKEAQVKIVDFGLAKLAGQSKLTRSGMTLGTAAYMSPEQSYGKTVDHRSDIFSFGVVLYEMLTGVSPFKGDYEQAVVYSIVNEEPEPITGLRTGVPMELERIVNKTLAKNPDERYQHSDEILNDLRRVQQTLTGKASRPVTAVAKDRWRKWAVSPIVWLIFIVFFGLMGGVLIFYPTQTIPFSKRDWILIADFENLTGDDVFDRSLNTALTVSIEQSKYVNVFPRRRIAGTLKRMKKTEVVKIDEIIGREIAEREGIRMLLLPGISAVGEAYALTAVIQEPITGDYLKTVIVRAQGKNEILASLDELARKIREDLGETRAAITQRSKPLKKVTASSLDALKQYSIGEENQRQLKYGDAKLYYENAYKIDSTFTTALAAWGMLEFEFYDRDKGKKLLSQAVGHVDDLTDLESSGIRLAYAIAVENDFEKALRIGKTFIADYPDLSAVHNNLGNVYQYLGRYEEAVVEFKEALRTEPTMMLAYDGITYNYVMHLGEVDSALIWGKRQISYEPETVWPYYRLGWAYLGVDSLEQAEAALAQALSIDSRFVMGLYDLASTYRLRGRYQEALAPLRKILEIDPTESTAFYRKGIIYHLVGNEQEARKNFNLFRKVAQAWVNEYPENGNNFIELGVVLTRLGKKKEGWTIGRKAMEIDSSNHFGFARLLCLHGKKQGAIAQLAKAIDGGFTNYIWMKIHPDFQSLYDQPEFMELLNKALKRQSISMSIK